MNRFFALLCVVFSLVLAPMAHAAGLDSSDSGWSTADQTSKKQDDGKLSGAEHHCCGQRIADHASLKVTDVPQETTSVYTLIEQNNLASITVGPLLQPPSRA
ncbi:MAG: hypothetical protein Q7N95_13055 [Alphaproteobacteria bacterium]|nr:hypothetical protein [Alphaproteobacteria bacterium]